MLAFKNSRGTLSPGPRQFGGRLARALCGTLIALTLSSLTVSPARAHLAILRQGVESGEVPNVNDHHGAKLASGDFNGDGYDDLATGCPDEGNSIGGGGDHGIVTINWGTKFGLTHESPMPRVLSVGEPNDFVVQFGQGLAVGDFDDDGYDDLAVGAPRADLLAADDVGQVHVYAGADFGINLAPYIILDESDAGAALENGDEFGYSMVTGKFNADQYDDLVVSGIGENNGAGAIYYFYGGPNGLTTAGAGVISQLTLGIPQEEGALFGFALAAGDFRPGPQDDLCVSAPYKTVGGLARAGAVYVLSGSAGGITTAGFQTRTAQSLGLGPQAHSFFGWSLAAGRFFLVDGDLDIAIGEPNYDVNGVSDAGRVVVMSTFIQPGKTAAAPNKVPQFQFLTQLESNGILRQGAQFGWDLAAGKFNTDSFDDLAVGAPGYSAAVGTEGVLWDNVGSADLFLGAANGPTGNGALSLDANDLNDWWFSFDEHLGWAVEFGDFDGNGREALAAGAPGKTYPAFIEDETAISEAGQVHIYAPWRQPGPNNPHRSALVYDCAQNIVYSQRLRQRLTPASTTKAFTALMAVEAMQKNPSLANTLYMVEPWIANNVSGSQYGLFPNELMSFEDLVEAMIAVSGNDAAYTIGDVLTGEDNVWTNGVSDLGNVLSDFANLMNQRAAQMGLSSAHKFSNPAGRPVGDHWTTAENMAKFSAEAMKNDDFRNLINNSSYNVVRYLPLNLLFPWIPLGPVLPVPDNVSYGWLNSLKGWHGPAIGIKPGINDDSQRTAIMAASLNQGDVTAVYFGHPRSDPDANALGRDLLQLVNANCEPTPPQPQPDPPASAHASESDIPTDDGLVECISVGIAPTSERQQQIDLVLQDRGTGESALTLFVSRNFELLIERNETCSFGMDRVDRWEGLSILNSGTELAEITVTTVPAGPTFILSLQPGEDAELPGGAGIGQTVDVSYIVVNTGADASLSIQELGYSTDIVLGQDRFNPPNWATLMNMSCAVEPMNISLCILGTDPNGGATVGLSVHDASLVGTAVPEDSDVPQSDLARTHLLRNAPNPFNPITTISYELFEPGTVSLRVYDLSGRLVRTLESNVTRAIGAYDVRWDGRDDSGGQVSSGTYLYRLMGEGFSETSKMVLLK